MTTRAAGTGKLRSFRRWTIGEPLPVTARLFRIL